MDIPCEKHSHCCRHPNIIIILRNLLLNANLRNIHIIKTRRVLNYIKTKAVYHLYIAFMISSL